MNYCSIRPAISFFLSEIGQSFILGFRFFVSAFFPFPICTSGGNVSARVNTPKLMRNK